MSSKCAECGTIFERNKASNQKYCSVECKGKAQSKWQTKEKKPNVECANCGKSIYKTNYELNKHQYSFCGNDCYGQWLAEHRAGEDHPRYREENYTELECAYCGQTITRAIHATRGKEKHFCDGDCMHKWQSENWQGENHHNWVERVEVSCAYCGQTVEKLECQIKNWEKSFCRRECMSKWQAEHWIGETAPAWKGGKSFEPYTSEFNGQLKRAIRKRDGYCCQLCGVRQKKKSHDVHHIDYDKTNNDPQNLITLCHRCHGFTNGNREYWQALLTEFLVQKLVCQKAA